MIRDLVNPKSRSSIICPPGNKDCSCLRERRLIDLTSFAARFRSGCLAIHPKLKFCTMSVLIDNGKNWNIGNTKCGSIGKYRLGVWTK